MPAPTTPASRPTWPQPEPAQPHDQRSERNIELARCLQAGRRAQATLNGGAPTTPAERRKLRQAIRDGKAARDTLICDNTDLVHACLAMYSDISRRSDTYDDLYQEGCCGLIKGADRFDPELGFRFSTYVKWWIRAYISAYKTGAGSRSIRLPRELVRNRARMLRALSEGEAFADAANRFGMSDREALEAIAAPVAVHYPDSGDSHEEAFDPGQTVDFDGALNSQELGDAIAGVLAERLQPEERDYLTLRYGLGGGEPLQIAEISQVWGMNRDELRTIEMRAFAKLSHPISRSKLAQAAGER